MQQEWMGMIFVLKDLSLPPGSSLILMLAQLPIILMNWFIFWSLLTSLLWLIEDNFFSEHELVRLISKAVENDDIDWELESDDLNVLEVVFGNGKHNKHHSCLIMFNHF